MNVLVKADLVSSHSSTTDTVRRPFTYQSGVGVNSISVQSVKSASEKST